MKYKAFLSYSHAADNALAADVQSALHQFAKKWRRFRALRTFRDTTNLSVTPALWHSITTALDESEYFILMASPEAAHSPWVEKEITYWLRSKPLENFLIVLTGGQLVWHEGPDIQDFDWERTNALPPILKGVFRQEPRYADLSWATKREDRSLRNPPFRAAIADLAAPLHGKDKDDLDGEDLRQYRKAVHFRQLISTTLAILLLISLGAAAYAWKQNGLAQQNASDAQESQRRAEENALLAQQRQKEAEDNAQEAYRQTEIANSERTNAQNQTRLANEQRKRAEQQQQLATTNAQLAKEGQQEAVKQTAEARRKNYLANVAYIMSVDETTRVSESAGIRSRLESLDEPLRSWEWQHLRLRVDNSLLAIDGGRLFEEVGAVVFSLDGSKIASGTDDSTVRVWDARDGKNLLTLPVNDDPRQTFVVRHVAFSPDGSHIAAGAEGGTVCVWDAASGAKLFDLLQHEAVDLKERPSIVALAFSRDGSKIMSATSEGYRVWDSKTGSLIKSEEITLQDTASVVTFDPDGSGLISYDGKRKELRVEGGGGSRLLSNLKGEIGYLGDDALSPDGSLFAASVRDNSINVWDVKTGDLKFDLTGHRTRVEDLAFSPDGERLVSCSYEGLRVWDLKTGNQITLLQGHQSTVQVAAFGPKDNLIVSGAEDGTLRTWDVSTAAHISLPQPHVIGRVALSRDGKYIAAGERGFGQEQSPRVLLYDAATLKVVRTLAPYVDNIVGIDFSHDGQRLAVAGSNGAVRVFAVESGELRGSIKGDHLVNALAFSGDGKYLAIGARDGYITVWMAEPLEPFWSIQGHEDIVDQLSFSKDGKRFVSGSWDESVKVWETETGVNLGTLKGHDAAVFSASFSPDGNRVASGSYDHTIKLWDDASFPQTLRGHTSGVTSAVFSGDGRRLFSASADTSLRLWDAEAAEFITVLRDASPMRDWSTEVGDVNSGLRNANFGIQSLALSADGARLVAALTEADPKRGGGAKSYLMIWNTRLPAGDGATVAPSPADAPGTATAAHGSGSVSGNVVSAVARHDFEVVRSFERRAVHGVPVINFVRFTRYGGSRNGASDHDLRYEKALALADGSAESLFRRGQAYFSGGDLALAVADFTEAIRLKPDYAEAFGQRGTAHYFNQENRDAVEDFGRAISLGAENIRGYLLLRGNIYYQWNRVDLALADFDRLVQLVPDRYLPFDERGKVYRKKREYARAAADFGKAIELEPRIPKLYDHRGEALYRAGDVAGAEKDFAEAIRLRYDFFSAHYHYACMLFDSGRYEEALRRWETLLQLEPEESQALAGKAISLEALGKKDEAERTLTEVLVKDKKFWNCAKEYEEDDFWATSGCRALHPVAARVRDAMIKTGVERLRGERPQ
jgi:WD40 repeat protein/tetratricopeptide (TPR) repeat protein